MFGWHKTQIMLQIIGNTPVVKLRNVVDDDAADIYVKLEYQNPGGSVKIVSL